MVPTLYSYFRSSASWRVRIALACKSVAYELVPINLRVGGGEQNSPEYRAINPQGLVPYFVDGDVALGQSVAICEYLEERYPEPPLLPRDGRARAAVRSLVQCIACDIHPLDNLRVLKYLKEPLGHSQEEIDTWYRHWIDLGFAAFERQLARHPSGPYCSGTQVSLADVFLVPQVFNARRLSMNLEAYPRIRAIDAHLATLPAFAGTAPATQPDAV